MKRTGSCWTWTLLLALSVTAEGLPRETPLEQDSGKPPLSRLVGKLTLVHGRLLLEVAVIEKGPSLPLPAYPDAPVLVTLLESSALEKVEGLARRELTRLPGLLATLRDDGSKYHPSKSPQVGTRGLEQHPLSLPAPDSREYFRIEGLLSFYHGRAMLFPLACSRALDPWEEWDTIVAADESLPPPIARKPAAAGKSESGPQRIPPWIRGRRTPEVAESPKPPSADPGAREGRQSEGESEPVEVAVREF